MFTFFWKCLRWSSLKVKVVSVHKGTSVIGGLQGSTATSSLVIFFLNCFFIPDYEQQPMLRPGSAIPNVHVTWQVMIRKFLWFLWKHSLLPPLWKLRFVPLSISIWGRLPVVCASQGCFSFPSRLFRFHRFRPVDCHVVLTVDKMQR